LRKEDGREDKENGAFIVEYLESPTSWAKVITLPKSEKCILNYLRKCSEIGLET
jgi:hypothetical protein